MSNVCGSSECYRYILSCGGDPESPSYIICLGCGAEGPMFDEISQRDTEDDDDNGDRDGDDCDDDDCDDYGYYDDDDNDDNDNDGDDNDDDDNDGDDCDDDDCYDDVCETKPRRPKECRTIDDVMKLLKDAIKDL